MRVVHVGPPLQRTGGPAGYLLELKRASEASPGKRHAVIFPETAPGRPPGKRDSRLREELRRFKRRLFGAPRYYRPPQEDVEREGGALAALVSRASEESTRLCRPVLDRSAGADVLFCHDVFAVEDAIARQGSAEIWLMIHSPMPIGLYLAWNWGRPDLSWQEVASLPDVKRAIDREIRIWSKVDRIVLPCREALEELVRVDARFADLGVPLEFILTGLGDARAPLDSMFRDAAPVALFLGSAQPYRGLDVLLEAVELLPRWRELPGTIAIAGPDRASVPIHRRLRALGRVKDVPRLLAAVDFLVNTNRFSLFDLSNIEAASAGRPLLLHDVGGNRALGRLVRGCRFFAPLDPAALAGALADTFSKSRAELARLGEQAREDYSAHLTAERMWQRHQELYDRSEARFGETRAARA